MVAISELWLPILLAAVVVFVASSIVHMFLGYHWNDMRAVPNESAVQDALRGLKIPPGEYLLPNRTSTCAAPSTRPGSSAVRWCC